MSLWDLLGEGRSPKQYEPGQLIYLQGTEATSFYYLKQGAARSYISLPGGDERVITVHRSGDLMGEASFFDQCPRVTSAMATAPCLVYSVNRAQLDDIFDLHPELAQPMLHYLARTVRILSHHVNNAALPAEQRIIRHLLSKYNESGHTIICTHEEIGQAVGASRVTVSRTISALAKAGILESGYGSIHIHSVRRLEKMEAF